MSAQLADPLTPELRDILNNLATGLFGLDACVKEPGKYVPPNPNLPWRAAGHTFTPTDLAVIPFFENLLRESSGDDDLQRFRLACSGSKISTPNIYRAFECVGPEHTFRNRYRLKKIALPNRASAPKVYQHQAFGRLHKFGKCFHSRRIPIVGKK